MARFGLRRKSTRKSRIKGFNPEYLNNRSELRRRKKIGLVRTVFSGVSLLCGASMIYVSMHYIPAFVQPKKVVKFVTGDSAALKTYDFDRKSTLSKLLGPYVDLFHMDRTYIRAGQRVSVKYDLPKGAYAKLEIVQCRQAWVVEIFKCDVIGQFSSTTKRRSGVESFALAQDGFYHFKQQAVNIPNNEPYRIVWERSL